LSVTLFLSSFLTSNSATTVLIILDSGLWEYPFTQYGQCKAHLSTFSADERADKPAEAVIGC